MFRLPTQVAKPHPDCPPPPPPTPMEHLLAAELLTPAVQSIDFRFGHIAVMPAGFREVAQALIERRITIEVNQAELEAHKGNVKGGTPLGMYDVRCNRIVVPKHNMFENHEDKVTLVHEATHAVQDRMKQLISAVQDEGAAQVAEVWYRKEAGIPLDTKHPIVLEVGEAMHARRHEKPVIATNMEIYRMNFVVRMVGGIADDAHVMDGF